MGEQVEGEGRGWPSLSTPPPAPLISPRSTSDPDEDVRENFAANLLNDDSVLPATNTFAENGGDDDCGSLIAELAKWDIQRQEEQGQQRGFRPPRDSSKALFLHDPEEDQDDDDDDPDRDAMMMRRINISSSNRSVMNSMMNQDDFFSKTLVTGDKKGNNSGEPDRKGGALQGYTMKYYEEELIKLRNDNFSLKLRIHLLEERQGLVVRPEDKNKENVFRINLDLRVEKEALKQQIEDKNKLLRDAYEALEQLERDCILVKQQYEEEIGQLKAERISEKSQQLLLDAFGLENLGAPLPDEHLFNGNVKGNNADENSNKWTEAISNLERDLAIEKDHSKDLKVRNDQLTLDIGSKDQEIQKLANETEALRHELETAKLEMGEELDMKHSECIELRKDLDDKEIKLAEVVAELEAERLARKQTEQRDYELRQNLERQMQAEFEGLEVKSQKTESDLRLKLKNSEENRVKTQLCVNGLTDMNMEQKDRIATLEMDVLTRDQIIDVLKAEHENLKFKVRRYRSNANSKDALAERGGANSDSTTKLDDILGKLEEAKGREDALMSEVEQLKELIDNKGKENASLNANSNVRKVSTSPFKAPSIRTRTGSGSSVVHSADLIFLREEVKLQKREIEILKKELCNCRSSFTRNGASKAIQKFEIFYRQQMGQIDQHHCRVVSLLRRRLEELADCIQNILESKRLDISFAGAGIGDLSVADISLLSGVLDESRRLSKSFMNYSGVFACGDRSKGLKSASHFDDMQLVEGDISDLKGDETQLPEVSDGIPLLLELPDSEKIIRSILLEESCHAVEPNSPRENYVGPSRGSSSSGCSPGSAMAGEQDHRASLSSEYEVLVEEAKLSAKKSLDLVRGELATKESLLEKLTGKQDETAKKLKECETVVLKLQAEVDCFRKDAEEAWKLTSKLAETTALVENLRVKNGFLKEKLAESEQQLAELRDATKAKIHKELIGLKNELAKNLMKNDEMQARLKGAEEAVKQYQSEVLTLTERHQTISDIKDQRIKDLEGDLDQIKTAHRLDVETYKEQIVRLGATVASISNSGDTDELSRLKARLKEAEEKLAKYRERQEKVDKTLRKQLAKTHVVLKKTKHAMDGGNNRDTN